MDVEPLPGEINVSQIKGDGLSDSQAGGVKQAEQV